MQLSSSRVPTHAIPKHPRVHTALGGLRHPPTPALQYDQPKQRVDTVVCASTKQGTSYVAPSMAGAATELEALERYVGVLLFVLCVSVWRLRNKSHEIQTRPTHSSHPHAPGPHRTQVLYSGARYLAHAGTLQSGRSQGCNREQCGAPWYPAVPRIHV